MQYNNLVITVYGNGKTAELAWIDADGLYMYQTWNVDGTPVGEVKRWEKGDDTPDRSNIVINYTNEVGGEKLEYQIEFSPIGEVLRGTVLEPGINQMLNASFLTGSDWFAKPMWNPMDFIAIPIVKAALNKAVENK